MTGSSLLGFVSLGPLARRTARYGALVSALVLLVAVGGGAIRLLPWLLAPEVPLDVALPFAEALASTAIEASLLVGVPLGGALAASAFVEEGEARAMAALGASPLGLVSGTLLVVALFAALSAASSYAWHPDVDRPGRSAAHLIEAARRACRTSKERNAWVPVLKLSWVCQQAAEPRLVGPLPSSNDRIWFSASALRPSEDLRQFGADDLKLHVPQTEGSPSLRMSVTSATVRGLPGWGRASLLEAPLRAVIVALSIVLGAAVAMGSVIGHAFTSRVLGASLGLVAGLVPLALLHRLTRGASSSAFLLLPLAGALAAALIGGLSSAAWRLVQRRLPTEDPGRVAPPWGR